MTAHFSVAQSNDFIQEGLAIDAKKQRHVIRTCKVHQYCAVLLSQKEETAVSCDTPPKIFMELKGGCRKLDFFLVGGGGGTKGASLTASPTLHLYSQYITNTQISMKRLHLRPNSVKLVSSCVILMFKRPFKFYTTNF